MNKHNLEKTLVMKCYISSKKKEIIYRNIGTGVNGIKRILVGS